LSRLSDSELRLQSPALLRKLTEELTIVRGELERYVQDRQSSAERG
jgi:hypothetical protein